jgi:hypothetical protein
VRLDNVTDVTRRQVTALWDATVAQQTTTALSKVSITEINVIQLVLFFVLLGSQNRTFGPCLAAMHGILVPGVQEMRLGFCRLGFGDERFLLLRVWGLQPPGFLLFRVA